MKRCSYKFSIIVPSFNQAKFLGSAIDSVLDQNYPELEIIVVDGGSTDGSLEILHSYGDRIKFISEEDEGQADAIKKGFSLASGEWLGWLNSDDVLMDSALHNVDEAICQNPQVSIIVGNGTYINENGDFIGDYPTITLEGESNTLAQLFKKGYLAQPSVFFKKDAYISVGGIDRGLEYAIDYDLWVRFAKADFAFAGLDKILSGNRWHPNTKTSQNLLSLLSEVVDIQIREFGKVSSYFVQAISDNLYTKFHSDVRGDRNHLFFRSIYFKSIWFLLNYSSPGYCISGLLLKNISKSGPIVGDVLSFRELVRAVGKFVGNSISRTVMRLWN